MELTRSVVLGLSISFIIHFFNVFHFLVMWLAFSYMVVGFFHKIFRQVYTLVLSVYSGVYCTSCLEYGCTISVGCVE